MVISGAWEEKTEARAPRGAVVPNMAVSWLLVGKLFLHFGLLWFSG